MIEQRTELGIYDTFYVNSELWCEVYGFDGDIIHASVINGAWDVSFDSKTGANLATSFLPANTIFITYLGPFPKGDYNKVICWILEQIVQGNIKNEPLTNIKLRYDEDKEEYGYDFDNDIPF